MQVNPQFRWTGPAEMPTIMPVTMPRAGIVIFTLFHFFKLYIFCYNLIDRLRFVSFQFAMLSILWPAREVKLKKIQREISHYHSLGALLDDDSLLQFGLPKMKWILRVWTIQNRHLSARTVNKSAITIQSLIPDPPPIIVHSLQRPINIVVGPQSTPLKAASAARNGG